MTNHLRQGLLACNSMFAGKYAHVTLQYLSTPTPGYNEMFAGAEWRRCEQV